MNLNRPVSRIRRRRRTRHRFADVSVRMDNVFSSLSFPPPAERDYSRADIRTDPSTREQRNGDIENAHDVETEETDSQLLQLEVQTPIHVSLENARHANAHTVPFCDITIGPSNSMDDILVELNSPQMRLDGAETMTTDDSNYSHPSSSEPDNLHSINNVRSPLQHWMQIVGILLVTGSVRFTRSQYALIRMLFYNFEVNPRTRTFPTTLNILAENIREHDLSRHTLPSFSTVQRCLRQGIEDLLGVRGYEIIYNSKEKNTRHPEKEKQAELQRWEARIKIIPVSEYARIDVAFPDFMQASETTTSSFFGNWDDSTLQQHNLTASTVPGIKHWDCLDDWPLVSNREDFYGPSDFIHATRSLEHVFPSRSLHRAYVGDVISFNLRSGVEFSEFVIHHFGREKACSSFESEGSQITGKLSAVSIVSGSKIAHQASHRPRKTQYTEHSEFVFLRQVMEMLRKETGPIVNTTIRSLNRQQQLFGTGDTISLLRPLGIQKDSGVRVIIVNRFNVEQGEYDEHAFCINSCLELSIDCERSWLSAMDNDDNIVTDIENVEIVTSAEPNQERKSVASQGCLMDGRRYVVYRFILFWDSFRTSESGSKSVEGVYILPLNIPSRARSGSSAVRVVSLLPPKIPGSVVFKEILDDIKTGTVKGFTDYDANGNEVVIFLDMIGCIADTPALNDVLDLRGHNANACCHLCRFHRHQNQPLEIRFGSQKIKLSRPMYMSTNVHGGKSWASRSSDVQRELREYNFDESTMKRLGMKDVDETPFAEYTEMFKKASKRIPLTEFGFPVVPGFFDGYRSLLIAPDHLMFGLAKNCINAVLSILPSKLHLESYQKQVITCLHRACLPCQSRIVNVQGKVLLPMSMTNVFALLTVSEYAFRVSIEENCKVSGNVSKKCFDVVELVGLLRKLYARLSFRPRVVEDGIYAVRQFNERNGVRYLRRTQTLVEEYIEKMKAASSYDQSDVKEYERLSKRKDADSKSKRGALVQKFRETNIIMNILDCPNVHRLLELAHVYLPMIGSVSRVTELEFEKGHQALKRAIENSNNIDSHIQAVTAAICNDWQGRIAMLLNTVNLQHETSTKRAMFRLLFGRMEGAVRSKIFSIDDDMRLSRAMGPGTLLRDMFKVQNRKVMGRLNPKRGDLYWVGIPYPEGMIEWYEQVHYSTLLLKLGSSDGCSFTSIKDFLFLRDKADRMLDDVFGDSDWKYIRRAQPRHHDGGSRKKVSEIMPGSIIKVHCIQNTSSPFLFSVLQESSNERSIIMFLYVLFLFEYDSKCGAAVIPCFPSDVTSPPECQEKHKKDIPPLTNKNIFSLMPNVNNLRLIVLAESCQRVFLEHLCSNCCIHDDNLTVGFSPQRDIRTTPHFLLHTREDGFPPRAA